MCCVFILPGILWLKLCWQYWQKGPTHDATLVLLAPRENFSIFWFKNIKHFLPKAHKTVRKIEKPLWELRLRIPFCTHHRACVFYFLKKSQICCSLMSCAHVFVLYRMLDIILRCCYITMYSVTTALKNGACTYRYISKQLHCKLVTQRLHEKSGNLWKLHHSVLSGKNFFTTLY